MKRFYRPIRDNGEIRGFQCWSCKHYNIDSHTFLCSNCGVHCVDNIQDIEITVKLDVLIELISLSKYAIQHAQEQEATVERIMVFINAGRVTGELINKLTQLGITTKELALFEL